LIMLTPIHRRCLIIGLLLALGLSLGCSSSIPPAIRGEASGEPLTLVSVTQVQQNPERYGGKRIRWGGSILNLRNLPNSTEIEVLSRPLASDGEPRLGVDGKGRYIAQFQGFIDPAEYAQDRLLTVVGNLVAVETRDVGEYPYRYPVLAVTDRYLWPVNPINDGYYRYPGGYPWGYPWNYAGFGYGPWYGPGFGPWYRPWYGPW
jgi:outer membrane lipoprotein